MGRVEQYLREVAEQATPVQVPDIDNQVAIHCRVDPNGRRALTFYGTSEARVRDAAMASWNAADDWLREGRPTVAPWQGGLFRASYSIGSAE